VKAVGEAEFRFRSDIVNDLQQRPAFVGARHRIFVQDDHRRRVAERIARPRQIAALDVLRCMIRGDRVRRRVETVGQDPDGDAVTVEAEGVQLVGYERWPHLGWSLCRHVAGACARE